MAIDITNLTTTTVRKYEKEKAEQKALGKTFDMEEHLKKVQEADARRLKSERSKIKKTYEEKVKASIEQAFEKEEEIKKKKEAPKTEPIASTDEDGWDVPIDMPVTFFDSNLSYELTGYRPITQTKGLDFNVAPFREAAETFERTGHYTEFPYGTIKFKQFWDRERDRCINGLTIGKYRITGDNYFWLNYYQLLDSASSHITVGEGLNKGFPTFVAKQYEYFHYMELCKKTNHDFCALKARAIGASEIACSLGARLYTTTRNTYQIYTASSDSQLVPTLTRCWQELDFLNSCTDGGFAHVRMKENSRYVKKASQVSKDGVESGPMSTIRGIISDDAGKLRGNRVETLFFEEAGLHTALEDSYIESEALVIVNGRRRGIRMVFGTGGSKGKQLAGLAKIFNNPEDFHILPYRHNYTEDGQTVYSGYFIPAFTIWFGDDELKIKGMDERGVTNEEAAKEWYTKRWAKLSDARVRIKEQAEHCFTPQQALILEGDNQFDQEKLTDQLARIQIAHEIEEPRRCRLTWQYKDGKINKDSRPTISYDEKGKILLLEEPITDQTHLPITNLYVAGVDAIDFDSSTSTGQTDVSQFAIIIFKRAIGMDLPKPVAIYKDRPKDVREAYDNALKLAQFYNCKIVLEATRINIVNYFKELHKESFFMLRTSATFSKTSRANRRQIGIPATREIIEHQLELIEMYINDYCDQIAFVELLEELIKYSYENKRKFDLVAAFGMVLLGNEEMMNKKPKRAAVLSKDLPKWGYFKNKYGEKEYGIIPKEDPQIEQNYGWLNYESENNY